jgi:hypothetical protein
MSYLGRGLEQVDNISKLDNITFNGGTTYALTKDSAAFTPISSNAILISIDGVVQQGNFSVSGTNIVFNFSPTSSNTCNWILHMGTGVAFTPADSSVTKDKANFISTSSAAGLQIKGDGTTDGTLQLNCSQNSHGVKIKSPAHSAGQSYTLTLPTTSPASNKIMQTDGSGNLSFVDTPSSNPTHIQRVTNNSDVTSITVTNCFSASYDIYKIIFYLSSTQANMPMSLRFRKNTSDDFTGANLDGNLIGARGTTTGTAFVNGGVASSTYLHLAHHDIYSGASSGLLGELTIANAYNRSDGRMHIKFQGVGDGASGIENFDGAWVYSGTEIATGFQLFSATSSARFNFSEINIYGYNQ